MQEESTAREVVSAVRSLAAGRGWSAVEELADRILSCRHATPVLVASGGNVDITAFRRWIERTMDTTEIAVTDMNRIAAAPFPGLFAGKLVALFQCRRILDAAEVSTVFEHFLSRPLDSFAIVFANAEQLESAEELDLMERAIWRVLVPGPPRDWGHQDLAAYRCYVWNAAPPRPFLEARCQRDHAELAALLRRPVADLDRESLDRERAVRLVDFAQDQIPPPAVGTGADCNRRRELENRVAEVRRNIRRRLDAEAPGIARQITTSLLTLEQKLLRSVEETACRELPARLDQITMSWRADREAELGRRAKEIAAEMQLLLGDVGTVTTIAPLSLLPGSMLSSVIGPGVFTAYLVRRVKRRSARQAIQAMIERAIPELRAGVHWTLADYRNRLISSLLESETALTAAACRPSAQMPSDRERLLSYRRRL